MKDARSRFDAGTTSNFEVLRAEVALANGQPPLIQARNDYRIAIEQLRQVLGFAPATGPNVTKVPEFVGTLDVGQPVTLRADGCAGGRAGQPSRAAAARPAARSAGEQNVKANRAGYLPEVDLVGGYDVGAQSVFGGLERPAGRLDGGRPGPVEHF